jgi:hypothetical protein
MQTFVPYADLNKSAAVLDSKRLNKQLLEGRQIYQILVQRRTKGGWVNHPAVLMWKNYDNALYAYLQAIKTECNRRNISTEKNWEAINQMYHWNWDRGNDVVMPPWWNDERVHESHRNNLYAKDPDFYVQFANANRVTCCDRCNYFWPTHTSFYNGELVEPFQYVKV